MESEVEKQLPRTYWTALVYREIAYHKVLEIYRFPGKSACLQKTLVNLLMQLCLNCDRM